MRGAYHGRFDGKAAVVLTAVSTSNDRAIRTMVRCPIDHNDSGIHAYTIRPAVSPL